MQQEKAQELREAWGDKPCDHPQLTKEYILGGQTGDYICTTCGALFTEHEGREMRKARGQ